MNDQKRKTIPVSFLDSSAGPVPFFHVWLYKSIKFNQDFELCVGNLVPAETVRQPGSVPGNIRIQMIEGDLDINGEKLSSGDTASVDEEKELRLCSERGAHFLLFDLC
jgi:hypothetical protein